MFIACNADDGRWKNVLEKQTFNSHNWSAVAAQREAGEAVSVTVLLDIPMQVDCASSLPAILVFCQAATSSGCSNYYRSKGGRQIGLKVTRRRRRRRKRRSRWTKVNVLTCKCLPKQSSTSFFEQQCMSVTEVWGCVVNVQRDWIYFAFVTATSSTLFIITVANSANAATFWQNYSWCSLVSIAPNQLMQMCLPCISFS